MLFILPLNSTLLDEKSVCNLLPRLFVWDRSNALISSTFSNKERNGKGGVVLCGQDDGKDDQIQVWGKLKDGDGRICLQRGEGWKGAAETQKREGSDFLSVISSSASHSVYMLYFD